MAKIPSLIIVQPTLQNGVLFPLTTKDIGEGKAELTTLQIIQKIIKRKFRILSPIALFIISSTGYQIRRVKVKKIVRRKLVHTNLTEIGMNNLRVDKFHSFNKSHHLTLHPTIEIPFPHRQIKLTILIKAYLIIKRIDNENI